MNTQKTKKRNHIAVYGPRQSERFDEDTLLSLALNLGKIISQKDFILGIPMVPGFSYWTAKGTKKANSCCVIGFSPAANKEEHQTHYGFPTKFVDTIIYTGFGFTGAELFLSRSSDIVLFVHAGIDLYHAFLVAREQQKDIRFFTDPSLGKDELLSYLKEKGEVKEGDFLVTNSIESICSLD